MSFLRMRFEKSSLLVALGVGAVGIVTTAAGCELIASADRSKISATGGTGDATGGGGAGGGTGGAAGGMGGAGGGMGGAGGGPECTVPADCGPTGSPCVEATCTDGVCGTQNTAPGTPLPAPDQTPGDCSTAVCDGNGNVAAMDDPNDVEDDTQSCTTDTCSMGNPVHTPVAVGTMCMDGGGTFCSVMGTCVECNSPADCTTGVCQNNACQAASCGDGVQNGDETDTDCGGSCGPCADGDSCLIPADCQSGVCTATVCQMASCTDNVDNGNETDIDCGGGACPPCGPGEGCMMPTDCAGGSCLMSVCAETCTDGEQNNDETDIDCGGPNCLDCPNGGMCGLDTDCTSGFCNTDTGTCATPTCNDGYQNGTETGIDCGGPCLACPGATCTLNSDCASGMCYEGTCVASVNGCDINTATNLTGMATATVTFPNGNLTYAPKCIRVTLGTDVTFNGSFVNHPLQGGQVINMMEVSATTGPFVTVTNTGTTATFDMPAAVTYPYYCVPHGTLGMNGAIFVVP